jgi:type IV secretion system protein VirD4
VLVVAPAGAGKGRNFIILNLLSTASPCIVLGIKGEAARVTVRYRRDIGHEVVILDPFRVATDKPASLNPLDRLAANSDIVADEAFASARRRTLAPPARAREEKARCNDGRLGPATHLADT